MTTSAFFFKHLRKLIT